MGRTSHVVRQIRNDGMKISGGLADRVVLAELGRRIAQIRLERNIGQAALAAEAGVGVATVQRLERGRSVALTSLIRVLRVLDLLESLDRAVPEPLPSPVDQLRLHGGRRRRAGASRSAGTQSTEPGPWRWGDEQHDET